MPDTAISPRAARRCPDPARARRCTAVRALPDDARSERPRRARRAIPAAGQAARTAIRRGQRVRRSRPGRVLRVGEGDRPLRPRPGARVLHVRRADDRGRAQALLPRPLVDRARAARRARSRAARPARVGALDGDASGGRPPRPRSPRSWTSRSSWCSKRSRPRPPIALTGWMRRSTSMTTSAAGRSPPATTRATRSRRHPPRLAPLLASLTPREQRILRLRFEHDLTQSEIGALLGVSQMHVSRTLRRTIARLQALAAT